MVRCRCLVLLPIVLAAHLTLLPALARDATPAAALFPVTPDPALCHEPPRPAADLLRFVGATPEATGAATTAADLTLPAGHPADEATIAALADSLIERFACFNGNEVLRGYSLATDRALADVIGSGEWTEQDMQDLLAMPGPKAPGDRLALLALDHVVVLPDGGVLAVVDIGYPDGSVDRQAIVSRLIDGRYRIDQRLWVVAVDEAAPGTPTP